MEIHTPPTSGKRVRPHPDYQEYLNQWSSLYKGNNYDSGLTGYFLSKSHEWAESAFDADARFPRVLEVGAGPGIHLGFVRHSFDEYLLTDLNPPFLEQVELHASHSARGAVRILTENAASLSFADNSFDRLIAAHVLEHLQRPHEVLLEWARVVKRGGVITLLLPCDPGLLWRFGRYAVARRKFIQSGMNYDYWMAREHVNPINNLVSLVRHYFPALNEQWLPTRIPSIDLNLFYIAHITV